MERTAQALMGDRRYIAEYENDEHVPYPAPTPFTAEQLAPFVDKDILTTFTVKVPLEEVAHASEGNLSDYIEEHCLDGLAVMQSPEYRAVGATFDEFDETYCGLVHLQVTCQLTRA